MMGKSSKKIIVKANCIDTIGPFFIDETYTIRLRKLHNGSITAQDKETNGTTVPFDSEKHFKQYFEVTYII